jgi:hypothetical protein
MCRELRLLVPLLLVCACTSVSKPTPITIRLVDTFKSDAITPAAAQVSSSSARTEWRFNQGTTAGSWEAGPDVTSLAVRDGRLTGRTTGAVPILHAAWQAREPDVLHALEIRMRVRRRSTRCAVRVV